MAGRGEGVRCGKCGKVDSVHLKTIRNGHEGTFSYYCIAHPVGPHRVTWCYIGKKVTGKKAD